MATALTLAVHLPGIILGHVHHETETIEVIGIRVENAREEHKHPTRDHLAEVHGSRGAARNENGDHGQGLIDI